MSPWVTFDSTSASIKDNADKDYVSYASQKRSSHLWMGNAEEDEYNVPLSASPEWWSGLSGVVSDMVVSVGEYEIFRDDMGQWVEKVQVSCEIRRRGPILVWKRKRANWTVDS